MNSMLNISRLFFLIRIIFLKINTSIQQSPVSALVKERGALHLVVRLVVVDDPVGFKNSVLTAIKENKKRFAQRLRNNVPVYKKIDIDE